MNKNETMHLLIINHSQSLNIWLQKANSSTHNSLLWNKDLTTILVLSYYESAF